MYDTYVRLRDEKGVTDYKVSQETGVSTATLSEWKKGTYTPKIDKIQRIATYFGVPIDTFLQTQEA